MHKDKVFVFLPVLRQRPRTWKVWAKASLLLLLMPLYWCVMLGLAVIMAPSFARDAVRARRDDGRFHGWYRQHFGDQPIDDVVASAPWEMAHFQGEDGYRIYDKRLAATADPVAFVASRSEANVTICRLIVAGRGQVE